MDAAGSLPRDLPGRYGRVIRDLERLFGATRTPAVVAGGWAVWRHGYAGRVTQDVDVVVPEDKVEEIRQAAMHCGFRFFEAPQGRWPKLMHLETQIDVDLLPEHGIPGTPLRPAPIAIAHPQTYEASYDELRYIPLTGLIELKLGASRAKDIADIIELINRNPAMLPAIAQHLATRHVSYPARFAELVQQAEQEQ